MVMPVFPAVSLIIPSIESLNFSERCSRLPSTRNLMLLSMNVGSSFTIMAPMSACTSSSGRPQFSSEKAKNEV